MSRIKHCHAIIMITGTSIGTGILGLPITTSQAGFFPTVLAFVLSWIFMTVAALYILDIKMQFRGSYTLSSLIKLTLGQTGHYVSSILILILLYALLCSYMMTGSAWFSLLCQSLVTLSPSLITLVFVVVFGGLVLFKERFIYPINNVLGFGLGIAFLMTIFLSLWPINLTLIQHIDFPAILPSMPLLLTTFGFSIVVPSVTEYLNYDAQATKSAIIIGSLIAFVTYLLWEWVTLGHIPLIGPMGLTSLNTMGDDGTGVIRSFAAITQNPWITFTGRLFAILAALTSFFGVSLALLHCLKDLTTFKVYQPKQLLLTLLTFAPPLIITLIYPKAFVQVLSFAGLEVAILLGFLPAIMVSKTRFIDWKKTNKSGFFSFIFRTKNMGVQLTAIFFMLVMIQECFNLIK